MKEAVRERKKVELTGIVQGVGFRPFVYRLARVHGLSGFVRNDGKGVTVEVEGDPDSLAGFLDELPHKVPPRASIETIEVKKLEPAGYELFRIDMSRDETEKTSLVSPEIATCDDCLGELFDTEDRRFGYPFINCTNCGPRFTIVKDIPYDREKTTMKEFVMCEECAGEYGDPEDRRFHAQPNACHVCGPQVFIDDESKRLEGEEAIRRAAEALKAGKIVAVKGLGGFHLACDALNESTVAELRKRKYREDKPFALMGSDLETVKQHCHVSEFEERLLLSPDRPIVIMEKWKGSKIASEVAPKQNYLGFMLPYTPLHHLLLRESGLLLVMTSGNISDEPISYENEEAKQRLGKIADMFLFHNRKIETRCDDSVTREFRGSEYMIRRSRGHSPSPISLPFELKEHILSCGGEVKNSFCVARGSHAFMSHYVGDLKNLETLQSFTTGVEHYSRLFSVHPKVVAHDLHPDYLSTKYAMGLGGVRRIGVQHHHAHIAAVMVENGLTDDVIGVALDGTGYGEDGKIWGCEFMKADMRSYERMAHLEYVPMPGGDAAVQEPYRMAISYLYKTFGDDMFDLELLKRFDSKKTEMLVEMMIRELNSPLASSAGRLFDAVSAILSIRDRINYEGQAAVELEMAAGDSEVDFSYPYDVDDEDGTWVINVAPMIESIVKDVAKGTSAAKISANFHRTMAEIVLDVCGKLANSCGLNKVALSGGVFQNMLLLSDVHDLLTKEGFEVYLHHQVPTNDGCVSLGQVAVAHHRS